MSCISIGVDLAWTRKNITGIALMNEKLEIIKHAVVMTDSQILRLCENTHADRKIVCIDAPLVFPEDAYAIRGCENQIRMHGIRILPVQRNFFMRRFGCLRGMELRQKLENRGFVLSTAQVRNQIIEVYPHATWKIVLGKVPKYKNTGSAKKAVAMETLLSKLRALNIKCIEHMDVHSAETPHLLDAIMCAYAGILHVQGKTRVVGDEKTGFIVY